MKKIDSRSTHHQCNKFIIVSAIAIVFAVAFITIFIYDGYPQRIIDHFTKQPQISFQPSHNDKAIDAWANCLDQLNISADVIFFGDSITRRCNFQEYFPDIAVCNLGMGSDTIVGMIDRVDMISSVSPGKLFVLGGINSLRDNTLDQSVHEYDALLSKISDNCHADTYIISVLPISSESSSSIGCSPSVIRSFNTRIESLSGKYSFTFVDVFSKMADADGFILSELTTDGVHLTESGYNIFTDAIAGYIK